MIKYNFLSINKKGCRKLDYFKELGYDVNKDIFEINIKHLTSGSRELVDVLCDYCVNEVKITYREYLRNIGLGGKYSCCKKCGSEKAKETNLEKYGVEHPLQLEEFQKKQKVTNLEKYGFEYLQQSKEIKLKSKETLIQNYGVEHISQTKKNKKRSSEWTSSNEFKEKSKETLNKNYAVSNPSKSIEIRKKIISNNIEKYGVEYPSKLPIIKEKIKNTIIEKYGIDNIVKNEIFRKKNFKLAQHDDYIKYIENNISSFKCVNGHHFEIKSDNFYKRLSSNLPLCTICYPISENNSIKELELLKFIESIYNGDIFPGWRDVLEIDIYLPELKLGFEFNGLYWHSEEFKENNYHLNKTLYFKEKGIRIIHIFEDDWNSNSEIIKSQIKNYLGLTEAKIFARKCYVKEINNSVEFLNNNHIQGQDQSNIKIGLFHQEQLVSVMTFNKFEGRNKLKKDEWNLSRFCNKLNYNVIGGASKLLAFFVKSYNPTRIISYADRSWSEGNLYYQLGFKLVNETKPDYKYIINNKQVHKSNFKKFKLLKEGFNGSEKEIMKLLGHKRIYDCGKLKFEINI